jgi:hypothetical protein
VNCVQDISKPNYVVRADNDIHYHSTPTTPPPHHPFLSSPGFLPCVAGVPSRYDQQNNKRPQGLLKADVEPTVPSSPLQATFCSVVNFSGHVCYKQKYTFFSRNAVATFVNITVVVFKILRTNNSLAWKLKSTCVIYKKKV